MKDTIEQMIIIVLRDPVHLLYYYVQLLRFSAKSPGKEPNTIYIIISSHANSPSIEVQGHDGKTPFYDIPVIGQRRYVVEGGHHLLLHVRDKDRVRTFSWQCIFSRRVNRLIVITILLGSCSILGTTLWLLGKAGIKGSSKLVRTLLELAKGTGN